MSGTTEQVDQTTGEIVKGSGNSFTSSQLRTIGNFEDAVTLLKDRKVATAETLGDGFNLLKDKDSVVGKEMVILGWSFHTSDEYSEQGEYVSLRLVTQDGKWIVNDGGTGIYRQMKDFTADGTQQFDGVYLRYGLSRSQYKYTDPESGKQRTGVTHYLDTRTK